MLEAGVEVVWVAVVAAGKDKRHVDVVVLRLGDEAGVLAHQHRLHVGALVASELLPVGVSFAQYVRVVAEVHCAVGNICGACGNAHCCFDIDRRVPTNADVATSGVLEVLENNVGGSVGSDAMVAREMGVLDVRVADLFALADGANSWILKIFLSFGINEKRKLENAAF